VQLVFTGGGVLALLLLVLVETLEVHRDVDLGLHAFDEVLEDVGDVDVLQFLGFLDDFAAALQVDHVEQLD